MYHKNQTDSVFENEDEFKFYAKSPKVDISMRDIIQLEESGKSEMEVELIYDDTVNNWWKSGQRWLYAEIVISKVDKPIS